MARKNSLLKIVGIEKMTEIVKEFGGTTIYIPTIENLTNEARNDEIVDRYRNGDTIDELRRNYGLSENHIRRILKGD